MSSAGFAGASIGVGVSRKGQASPSEKPLQIALIGLGKRGFQFLSLVLDHPEVQLKALVDPDPQRLGRAKKIAAQKGLLTYRDTGPLSRLAQAEELDAVVIASPPEHHVSQALFCLGAGLHTYLEKPLALNLDDALKLCEFSEIALKEKKILQIGYQRRYSPRYRASVESIHSGTQAISFIKSQWHTPGHPGKRKPWLLDSKRSGGLLLEQVSHQFDLFNWVWETHPQKVIAVGQIEKDTSHPSEQIALNLIYPQGMVQMSLFTGAVSDRRFGGIQEVAMGDRCGIDLGQALKFGPEGKAHSLSEGGGSDTRLAFDAFIESAKKGQKPLANADSALRAAQVAWLAETALHSESSVALWADHFGADSPSEV